MENSAVRKGEQGKEKLKIQVIREKREEREGGKKEKKKEEEKEEKVQRKVMCRLLLVSRNKLEVKLRLSVKLAPVIMRIRRR